MYYDTLKYRKKDVRGDGHLQIRLFSAKKGDRIIWE